MACIYNGIIAKINSYYNAITYWSIAINAFQQLASFIQVFHPICKFCSEHKLT